MMEDFLNLLTVEGPDLGAKTREPTVRDVLIQYYKITSDQEGSELLADNYLDKIKEALGV